MGGSASLEASVGAGMGAVEASVSVGVEVHAEKGTASTTGKEVTLSTGQSWVIPKGTGEWIGPQGYRYHYDNATYAVDIEVLKAAVNPKGKAPRTMEKFGEDSKEHKKLVLLTAKGKFSANIIQGALELGSVPMTAQEFAAACPAGGGRPNTGIVASATGMGGPKEQIVKKIPAGSRPPANVKVHKGSN